MRCLMLPRLSITGTFLVIQVLWRTGVRVSELVSIRPRDIGWANQDSFAIHLVRSGMDLRRVQLLLGHSSLNLTQIYLQFKDDDIREVARDK